MMAVSAVAMNDVSLPIDTWLSNHICDRLSTVSETSMSSVSDGSGQPKSMVSAAKRVSVIGVESLICVVAFACTASAAAHKMVMIGFIISNSSVSECYSNIYTQRCALSRACGFSEIGHQHRVCLD